MLERSRFARQSLWYSIIRRLGICSRSTRPLAINANESFFFKIGHNVFPYCWPTTIHYHYQLTSRLRSQLAIYLAIKRQNYSNQNHSYYIIASQLSNSTVGYRKYLVIRYNLVQIIITVRMLDVRCQSSFSCGQFPLSLYGILYLDKDSSLCLCCCFFLVAKGIAQSQKASLVLHLLFL